MEFCIYIVLKSHLPKNLGDCFILYSNRTYIYYKLKSTNYQFVKAFKFISFETKAGNKIVYLVETVRRFMILMSLKVLNFFLFIF